MCMGGVRGGLPFVWSCAFHIEYYTGKAREEMWRRKKKKTPLHFSFFIKKKLWNVWQSEFKQRSTDQICTWCKELKIQMLFVSGEEKKTEMFLFNARAGLMICVDSARTHLLVSCLSNWSLWRQRGLRSGSCNVLSFGFADSFTFFLQPSSNTAHLIILMHVASKTVWISKMSFCNFPLAFFFLLF